LLDLNQDTNQSSLGKK